MKKALLFLVILCGGMSLVQAQEVTNGPTIIFEEELHDYGEIAYEGNGHCTFKFTNTGNSPLIITRAQGTCGCTVPSWPHEPIAPGASSEIKVKYDTKRPGGFSKGVTIYSNAVNDSAKSIKIKGTVLPKPIPGTPVSTTGPAVSK